MKIILSVYAISRLKETSNNTSSTTAPIIFTIRKPSHKTNGSSVFVESDSRVPDTTAAWTKQHRAWCIAVICWSGRPISVSPVLPSGHPQYSRVFTPAVVYRATGLYRMSSSLTPDIMRSSARQLVKTTGQLIELQDVERTTEWWHSNRRPPGTQHVQCGQ